MTANRYVMSENNEWLILPVSGLTGTTAQLTAMSFPRRRESSL
jgi:hypothetical protein